MFIQTEPMPDVNRMKFYPGKPVLNSGAVEFTDEDATERSPLANSLLKIMKYAGVLFSTLLLFEGRATEA